MATIKGNYLGELRNQLTHVASKNEIITDAPLDNNGKGEAFSPTDLFCAALGSCMVTIMGISARQMNIEIISCEYEIVKTMQSNPRKISKIEIDLKIKTSPISDSQQEKLINAAKNCPVALSISDSIEKVYQFEFNN